MRERAATGCQSMRHHALKHDAIRRGLMSGDERDAHHTGLRKLTGDMLLTLPASRGRPPLSVCKPPMQMRNEITREWIDNQSL